MAMRISVTSCTEPSPGLTARWPGQHTADFRVMQRCMARALPCILQGQGLAGSDLQTCWGPPPCITLSATQVVQGLHVRLASAPVSNMLACCRAVVQHTSLPTPRQTSLLCLWAVCATVISTCFVSHKGVCCRARVPGAQPQCMGRWACQHRRAVRQSLLRGHSAGRGPDSSEPCPGCVAWGVAASAQPCQEHRWGCSDSRQQITRMLMIGGVS